MTPRTTQLTREDGIESYEIVVGNLKVYIDFVAEGVYVDRMDMLDLPLVTQDLGNGFLVDRNANDREQVVGVEVIS